MKRSFRMIALLMALVFSVSAVSGCYGGFVLTKKVYKWNGTVGGKFVNSLVMWGLFILPVYEICGIVDFLILNTIEFWQGSNPMAMKPGEKETRTVAIKDQEFEITATQNRFDITALSGEHAGVTSTLVYDPATQAWYWQAENGLKKIAQFNPHGDQLVQFINPNSK